MCVDATGKKSGRGAYICPNAECLKKARKSRALERAFETAIGRGCLRGAAGADRGLSMEKILSMIGLAHKAGRVEIGEEPVGSAARAKKARIILVAGDAAASSVRRAMGFANTGSCLCLIGPGNQRGAGKGSGAHKLRYGGHYGHGLCRRHCEKAGGAGPAALWQAPPSVWL